MIAWILGIGTLISFATFFATRLFAGAKAPRARPRPLRVPTGCVDCGRCARKRIGPEDV